MCLSLRRPALAAVGVLAGVSLAACAQSPRDVQGASSPANESGTKVPAVSPHEVLLAVAGAASLTRLPEGLRPSLATASKDTGFSVLGQRGCLPQFDTTSVDLANCTFGAANAEKTLIMVGDSHSSMWLPAFDAIGARLGWKIINFNKVNCGASAIEPYLYQESRPYRECVTWRRWVNGKINELKPEAVVFTSEVADFIKLGDGTKITPEIWRAGLVKTLAAITSPVTRKVIVGDIPYVWPNAYRAGPNCLATHKDDVTSCSAPRAKAVSGKYVRAEKAAAAEGAAHYIDVAPWFCTNRCWSVVNAMQVYSDWQHITATYARYVSGAMQHALARDGVR